jgi:protein-S-isoprenylcysteine O-methyltransferase Ste14
MKQKDLLTQAENNHILRSMSTNSAHESWWQTSEVVFGIPLLTAIALQLIVPLRVTHGFLLPFITAVGIAFFIAGVILILAARRQFANHGQYTDPGHPTTNLVISGVFSFSRNPLYLGVVDIVIGVALVINSLWVLIFLLPSLVACHLILIMPEEKYLAARFREEYRTYTARVHRWLGRKRRLR